MRGQKRDFALALIFADILRARAKLEGKKKGQGQNIEGKNTTAKKTRAKIRARENLSEK